MPGCDLDVERIRGLEAGVNVHVHLAEEDLAQVEEGHVEVARFGQPLHEVGWDRLVLVSWWAANVAEHLGIPAPVLHDLGRCLHEVPLGIGRREPGEPGLGERHVEDVAELVEQRGHLLVAEERWPVAVGFGEVGQDRGHRDDPVPVGVDLAAGTSGNAAA